MSCRYAVLDNGHAPDTIANNNKPLAGLAAWPEQVNGLWHMAGFESSRDRY